MTQFGHAARAGEAKRPADLHDMEDGTAVEDIQSSRVLPIIPAGSWFARIVLWSALLLLTVAGITIILVRPSSLTSAGGLGALVLIGTILAVLGLHRMTMAERRERHRLETLGMTDFTTGVFNRRYLYLRLQNELEQVNRHGGKLAVLYIDLDQFKRVNDRYGHSVGDWVLRRVASLMQSTLRSPDVLGRLGGDEFLIILPRTDHGGAYRAARRLVDDVEERVFRTPAGEEIGFIGVSVGLASCPPDGFATQELIAAADQALYRAKQKGGGIHPVENNVSTSGRNEEDDGDEE